jgi:hypothetical protein
MMGEISVDLHAPDDTRALMRMELCGGAVRTPLNTGHDLPNAHTDDGSRP